MYTSEEAEGKRLRNPFDTITEGIGINRLTRNFNEAHIHAAFKGQRSPSSCPESVCAAVSVGSCISVLGTISQLLRTPRPIPCAQALTGRRWRWLHTCCATTASSSAAQQR